MMQTRKLGSSDLIVSAVGLGCNNFSRPGTPTATLDGTRAVLDAAIEAGVTFLDTAELYGDPKGGSEELMGQALEGRRDKVVIATKFGHHAGGPTGSDSWGSNGSASYIAHAVEGSLTRLRTDHIDLYQLHTPDPKTPIGETLEALTGLIREGKVRFIGHSNLSAEQIREADTVAKELGLLPFVSAQNEYSLLARGVESDVLPAVREARLGFLPYFPLYNGLLTGKYTREGGEGRLTRQRPEVLASVDWDLMDRYEALCKDAGVTMLKATFAWLLAQPGVSSVIAGATTPEQVAANAEAGSTVLPDDVLTAISALFA
ncbi:MAG TPA: aldo/keto reductase [Propionibacteriaceae bacterium]|nr:aldo/keto reductase [Propionibacteriaceae bacterium]